MNEIAAYSTVAMTLGLVVTRPRIGESFRVTPALAALGGVLFLFALGIVKPGHWLYAAANLRSPFITIASIMVMTEVAERVGLLACWAARIERRAASPRALFTWVFALGALTSSLLNNDAAILVLTPVVLALVRRRYPTRPELLVPFAFAVFMSAGVAALPVSNPMNMVVAELSGIGFNSYGKHMLPVAAAGWIIVYVGLRVMFAGALRDPGAAAGDSPSAESSPAQRWMMLLLVAVLLAYPIVGYLGGPVWAVASSGALASLGIARGQLGVGPGPILRRGVSWGTLVFLLAVLVMSLGLRDVGLVDRLTSWYAGSGLATIGITSAIGSALLNNHPMSYLNLLALAPVSADHDLRVLAALVGGDLGPRLLPMGSLAGLLWFEQLRRHGVEIGLGTFFKVGVLLAAPTLAVSLAMLALC